MQSLPIATVYDLEKAFDSVDQTFLLSKLINSGLNGPMLVTIKSSLSNRKASIQVTDYIDMSFVPLNGLPQGAILSSHFLIFYISHYILYGGLPPRKYADDSTSLSSKENLSTSLEKAENYSYKWRQVLNRDKTEQINFSKGVFQSNYRFVERSKILGLWFERDMSFKTHAAIISASVVKLWKETSILITQGLNPFYAVRIFDSYVKPRVTYCITIWFHQNMTSLDKTEWSVHKSIFGIKKY